MGQRLRRWPIIDPALDQSHALLGLHSIKELSPIPPPYEETKPIAEPTVPQNNMTVMIMTIGAVIGWHTCSHLYSLASASLLKLNVAEVHLNMTTEFFWVVTRQTGDVAG